MANLKGDVNKILAKLQEPEHGCTVKTSGKGHWRVRRPGHQPITVSRSPSDQRALANIISDVRRYLGIELDPSRQ